MITSMSSSDGTGRTNPVPAPGLTGTGPKSVPTDQISTEGAAFLKTALAQVPEVRPEVVARARALAADPAYPPVSVLRQVAGQILASPDLSEDQS